LGGRPTREVPALSTADRHNQATYRPGHWAAANGAKAGGLVTYRIRVNPDDLRLSAREIDEVGQGYLALADRSLRVGLDAPSYDGQFGPQVRAVGIEGSARLRSLADRLSEQAQELRRIADAFDGVDRASQQGMGSWREQLLGLHQTGLRFMDELDLSWKTDGADLGEDYPPDWARWLPGLWFLWWLYCRLRGEDGTEAQQAAQAYATYRTGEWESSADQPSVQAQRPILEYVADQIASPEFIWDLLSNGDFQRLLANARGLPQIIVAVPVFRGLLDYESAMPLLRSFGEMPMPMLRRIALDETAQSIGRTLGRTVGDSLLGPAIIVGYGLTIAPEQVENILTGARWNEYAADLAVDSGGFIVSEGVGYVAGVTAFSLGLGPPGAVGGKLGGDVLAGVVWDYLADKYAWRDQLEEIIRNAPAAMVNPPLPQTPIPIPTPDLTPVSTGTPTPPGPTETPTPSSN